MSINSLSPHVYLARIRDGYPDLAREIFPCEIVEWNPTMIRRKLNRDSHFSMASTFIQNTCQYLVMYAKLFASRIFCLLATVFDGTTVCVCVCASIEIRLSEPLVPV